MARGHHDIGGSERDSGPIERGEHTLEDWEILADAVNQALGVVGVKRTDELRRAREEMDSELYRSLKYYERWIASMETILIEKKILTREEIDRRMGEFDKKWGEP
jgi:nitrile hydratase